MPDALPDNRSGAVHPPRKEVFGMRASRIRVRIQCLAAALAPTLAALAVVAMSPMGGAVAEAKAPVSARGVFGGTMSNGWPVVIEVSKDGHSIKRAVGAVYADCTNEGIYAYPSLWARVRISRTGAFKGMGADSWNDAGVEAKSAEVIQGKVNRAHTLITGTWRALATFTQPDGTVDTCDTGALKFTARR